MIWLSAGLAMLTTSTLVLLLALVLQAGRGPRLARMLQNPATLPTVQSPVWIALGTLSNELTIAGVLALWLWALRASRRAVLPLSRPSLGAVAGALLLTFGLAPLGEVAGEVVHRWVKNPITSSSVVRHAAKSANPATLVLLVVCLALLPAIVEEAMFRGALTAAFLQRSVVAGVLVPSLLFAIFHMEPAQVAGTFVLGIGFGAIRVLTDALPPSMIAHAIYNTAVIFAVRENPGPTTVRLGIGPVALGLGVALLGLALLFRARPARLDGRGEHENRA